MDEKTVAVSMAAKDYDMDYDTALRLWNKVDGDYFLFHQELEEYIKERRRTYEKG